VTSLSAVLDRDGVLICSAVLSRESVCDLHRHFDGINRERAGARSFDLPEEISGLIGPRAPLGALAAQAAGASVRPVRVLLFDKTLRQTGRFPGIRIAPLRSRPDMTLPDTDHGA
jgi:hypothetical protein